MSELTRRYVVMTMAATAPFDHADRDAPFVLKPWKDPAALIALKAYREHCYAALARDLDEWIRVIETGPVARGDVGRRNAEHLASLNVTRDRSRAGGARRSGTREKTRAKPTAGPRRPPARGRASATAKRAKRRRP